MTSLNTHKYINSTLHGIFIEFIPNRIFTVSVSFFWATLYNCNNKLSNICVTLALAGSTSHVYNTISTVSSFLNIPRYDVCSNTINAAFTILILMNVKC